MIEQSCTAWLEDLASSNPTPGGGAAAAFVGAIGVSLGAMVGNLTTGKKKYAEVEEEMKRLTEKSLELSKKLQAMVKADGESFLPVLKAYGMASDTQEEKKAKEMAVQTALEGAVEIPMNILFLCIEALEWIEEFQKKGSRFAVSDAGCAASCCRAAMESARLSVFINLKLMKDQNAAEAFREKIEEAFSRGIAMAERIYHKVEEELNP